MTKHPQAPQMACNIAIDYSSVPGSRILPFEFSLDLNNSVLEPGPGQRQKFCYHVRAMGGSDDFRYVNLSYFMIGLCDDITQDQLGEICVVKNGIPEMVVLGENVRLVTPDCPDPNTGCSGLKFQFSLDHVRGEMDVCFELCRPYRVGSQPVCVYGSGVARNVLSLCGPVCRIDENCVRTAHQRARVTVPITLTPYVRVGEASAWCCGAPVFCAVGSRQIPPCSSCTFLVTQMMCVSVPITFTADATAGEADIECLGSPAPCDPRTPGGMPPCNTCDPE